MSTLALGQRPVKGVLCHLREDLWFSLYLVTRRRQAWWRAAWAFGDGVNDHGQVVGNENNAKNNEELIAALWSGGHGYDLDTLIAPTRCR
jgi:hypothetical protein